MARETNYRSGLIKRLKVMFPGCECLYNDAEVVQGIPDLMVLYKKNWAMLETKAWKNAKRQPNQPWYVDHFNKMSFAAFISPDNEKEVLDELKRAFLCS